MTVATDAKKIFGTTLYIGTVPIETKFGTFICHTYQNLVHKGYVIALSYGDIKASTLYTRIHSSCVTSETMRSMDCDCVHQLEGAMQRISEKGHGILFYLIQEGRGCGYVGKARACMLVQYHKDQISTFDAYARLGMKADYRDYRNIWEVATMLGIEHSDFVLLTNNPDKIKGLQDVGLNVSNVESIEVAPSPFNQSYLVSKQKTGHLLYKTKTKVSKYNMDFETVEPFTPYELPQCSRYIHCASYYVPIKPVNQQMEFEIEELKELSSKGISYTLVSQIDENKQLVKIHSKDLDSVPIRPYWFKVNMFYDIASHSDFVVLTYGDLKNKVPLVRTHSESLFNRFPLSTKVYREKYKKSLEAIVKNQSGIIVLLYHDGRGSGLGSFILNQTQDELKTGIPIDSRDYDAVAMLLDHFIPSKSMNVLYSSSSRVRLKKALEKQGLNVQKWLQIDDHQDQLGHSLIASRIEDAPNHLWHIDAKTFKFDSHKTYLLSGIGSSEAHARYFLHLAQKYHSNINVRYVPLSALQACPRSQSVLVLFSQGLSPAVEEALSLWEYKDIVLLTAVTSQNKDAHKRKILEKLVQNHSQIYAFPLEDEYTTLMRVVGPLAGYYLIYKILHPTPHKPLSEDKTLHAALLNTKKKQASEVFVKSLQTHPHVVFLASYPFNQLLKNIVHKFEEGAFLASTRVFDYSEFAHGPYQNIEYQYDRGQKVHFILLVHSPRDLEASNRLRLMLENRYEIWQVNSHLPEDLAILEYEMIFNHFVLAWMKMMNIDQLNWHGKDKQKHLYDWRPVKETQTSKLN